LFPKFTLLLKISIYYYEKKSFFASYKGVSCVILFILLVS
jgi:hypothetical protein